MFVCISLFSGQDADITTNDIERPKENGEYDSCPVIEVEAEAEKKKKKRNRNKKGGLKGLAQTNPPSIPIVELFPDQVFPEGEILQYRSGKDDRTAKDRFTSEEKRALDRIHESIYNEVRLAAEAHRQVSSCISSRM